MNLQDPFNRVSGKRQREFQAFQQHLQQAGVDSMEKATTLMQKSRRRMLISCLVVLIICIVVVLVSPQSQGVVLAFGGVILLWLIITLVRGERMLRLYMKKEFSADDPSA